MAKKVIGKRGVTKREILKRLLVAYEYIQDNPGEKISIERLSLIAGLSEYHLFKSFKYVFGQTPHQLINSVKLQKARDLLKDRQHTITEIVKLLGFADVPSFSKLFKKTYGYAPSTLQKTHIITTKT